MKFVAYERAKQGTGASRRLRISGKTPGIVYGGEGQPQLIELDHNALWHGPRVARTRNSLAAFPSQIAQPGRAHAGSPS